MTAGTPEVFVWTDPIAPAAVVRVRATDGTTYHRYTDWLDPAARSYASWLDNANPDYDPARERWVADTGPDEDGRLHGWRWNRLIEHAGTLTDITAPSDTPKTWRTDDLLFPAVGYTAAVAGFEAIIWKLAGDRIPHWTVDQVRREFGIRSNGWVSERLDRLGAGIDRITGVVVRRLVGDMGNATYEIRHWAAADKPEPDVMERLDAEYCVSCDVRMLPGTTHPHPTVPVLVTVTRR